MSLQEKTGTLKHECAFCGAENAPPPIPQTPNGVSLSLAAQCLVMLRAYPSGLRADQFPTWIKECECHATQEDVIHALARLELLGMALPLQGGGASKAKVWIEHPNPDGDGERIHILLRHVEALHLLLDLIDEGSVKHEHPREDGDPALWSHGPLPAPLLTRGWPEACLATTRAYWDPDTFKAWSDSLPTVHQLIGDHAFQDLAASTFSQDSPHAKPK